MANTMQSALETIFMKAAESLGKPECEKLLAKVFESEKPTLEVKPKAETSKRITRMSPTLSNQLKAELIKVGLTFSEDDKKEFDKNKKEFVAYIDGLTDDNFTAQGLADHMRNFANVKKPAAAPAEKEEEKPKKGKAKKVAKKEEAPAVAETKKTMWEEMNEVKAPPPPSNVADIFDLTLDDLQTIEKIATPEGGPVGVYWDGDFGRWVRGPEEDSDEDHDERKFKGISYEVGCTTGRLYDTTTNEAGVFVGFAGVGKFREFK